MHRSVLFLFRALFTLCLFLIFNFQASAQSLPANMQFNADSSMLITGGVTSTGFYDESVINDVYLDFYDAAYWELMMDNYNTENFVLASLSYQGEKYDSVAVQFKGQTSFVKQVKEGSEKLSFSVKLNEIIDGQDIDAYNNFNFNNAADDNSFMKEVLYARLSRDILPSLKGNYIKLYLNGAYWGLYTNIQQLNGDFIEEWFPEDEGIRWRADAEDTTSTDPQDPPPPPQGVEGTMEPGGGAQWGDGTAALNYLGDTLEAYQQYYTVKDSDLENPWKYLLEVCDLLNNTDSTAVYDSLQRVMDVDATLWFLAQENAFSDDDSYIHKGKMDYYLFWEEASGRMLPLEFDGNSAMSLRNHDWSPFMNEEDPNYPLLNILLSVPELRQRYIAHMKTLLDIAFDPDKAHGIINTYESMIAPLVEEDPKIDFDLTMHKLDVNRMHSFINMRPEIILAHEDFGFESPEITMVQQWQDGQEMCTGADCPSPLRNKEVRITAQASHPEGIAMLRLYSGTGIKGRFELQEMNDLGEGADETAADGIYSATIPGQEAGSRVRYYLEAIAADSAGTASYMPERASYEVFTYSIRAPQANEQLVVINEILASNNLSHADEQGEYDDWVELYNLSVAPVYLEGWHLSDDPDDLYKWAFPAVEIDGNGYLGIWADKDTAQGPLHASFKLSAGGEALVLTNADSAIVDQMEFGIQTSDVSLGRWPNGTGDFLEMTPSILAENMMVTSSQEQLTLMKAIRIWPNPSDGLVHIELPEENQNLPGELMVISISGKIVYNASIESLSGLIDLDLSHLEPGIYFLRCGSYTGRMVLY